MNIFKKIISASFLFMLSINLSFAQNDMMDQFMQDFEQMEEELKQLLGDDGILMDTMIIQGFHDLQSGAFGDIFNDPQLKDMMDMMEQSFQQFDMNDFEQLMEGFDFGNGPLVPAPEKLPEGKETDKKKKKRKSYTL